MSEVGGDGFGDEVEEVAVLPAAGFDGGEHRLHEATPSRALSAKREFPPNHRALTGIVGRFDPFHFEKGPPTLTVVMPPDGQR